VSVDEHFVSPANTTIVLNCSLPQNGNVTWFHDSKMIVPVNDDDKKEPKQFHVQVGKLSWHHVYIQK